MRTGALRSKSQPPTTRCASRSRPPARGPCMQCAATASSGSSSPRPGCQSLSCCRCEACGRCGQWPSCCKWVGAAGWGQAGKLCISGSLSVRPVRPRTSSCRSVGCVGSRHSPSCCRCCGVATGRAIARHFINSTKGHLCGQRAEVGMTVAADAKLQMGGVDRGGRICKLVSLAGLRDAAML